jgi:hypothetical protein
MGASFGQLGTANPEVLRVVDALDFGFVAHLPVLLFPAKLRRPAPLAC